MSSIQPINDKSSIIFDELFSRFQNLDTGAILVYLIDAVKESALIHLAEQFHITGNEGWLNCTTEQEKRNLIKNAIKLHKYRGTKYSLLKVLEVLNLNGEISEWFEYDGEPFYFRLAINLNRSYDSNLENQLLELINENKNMRSKLEKLLVYLESIAHQKMASYVIASEVITL